MNTTTLRVFRVSDSAIDQVYQRTTQPRQKRVVRLKLNERGNQRLFLEVKRNDLSGSLRGDHVFYMCKTMEYPLGSTFWYKMQRRWGVFHGFAVTKR